MTITISHPVLERIARALESGDRAALASLYAPAATYTSVGGSHPPASPLSLSGSDIGDYLRGIPIEIRIELDDSLVGTDGRISMTTSCRFPAGGTAVTAHLIELDGESRIVSHRCIEVVDG